MPSRDIQIPLFLWIATAIIVHLFWGGGTHQVAVVLEEKAALRGFAARIQREVQAELRPIPIAMLESDSTSPPKTEEPDEVVEPEEPQPAEPPKQPKKIERPATNTEKPQVKPEEPKPEKKDPEPKPEEKKDLQLQAKPLEQATPQELQIERQKRIAVRQQVEDKNQKDNPDAKFLGENANRVKEETQAKITSTDQNDPKPSPGSSQQQQTAQEPGNADESRVASAYGDQEEGSALPQTPAPAPERQERTPAQATQDSKPDRRTPAEAASRPSHRAPTLGPGQSAQEPDPGARQSPDLVAGEHEAYSMGGPAQPRPKRKRLPPVKATSPSDLFGLGRSATTASGVKLNLSHTDAVAVVGQEQLETDRRMDQLRRRSKRAGSWKTAGIERYRSAIENYVPSVKPGNTTALNTAASPFATYLNEIHNRIHPIFADDFLGSLSRLPSSDPMNRPELKAEVEIVVSKSDGSLVRRGLTKSSGILQFDVSALASVDRAAPFGPPPASIVSPDGNVYLHWEFYRNPDYACSTYFAHPFILKAAPAPTTPKPAPHEPGPNELLGPRIMPTHHRMPNARQSKAIQL